MTPKRILLMVVLCVVQASSWAQQTKAGVTASAELQLTITLNDVFLIQPDGSGSSAYDSFAIEVFDFGASTQFFGGSAPMNPPDAIGSNAEGESVLFSGVDANDPGFDAFDVGLFPGDTIVLTQNVEASATTPGSLFFSQVASEISIFFDSFGSEDETFLFDFDVEAQLTGELDIASQPGMALVFAAGEEIEGFADSTLVGDPNGFILFASEESTYYDIFSSSDSPGLVSVNEAGGPINIPVEFSPGDNQFEITFRSTLLVNASAEIPEPGASLLVAVAGLTTAAGRRRHC